MTAQELAAYVGKSATLESEGVSIPVTIKDARESYGRIDVLVSPTQGEGETWVDVKRVRMT